MKKELRIKILKERTRAKKIRELSKEKEYEESWKLMEEKYKLDNKIDFYIKLSEALEKKDNKHLKR